MAFKGLIGARTTCRNQEEKRKVSGFKVAISGFKVAVTGHKVALSGT